MATSAQAYRRNQRMRALQHYSNSEAPSCACCGEGIYEFLVLDHVDGGAGMNRPRHLFMILEKQGYPPGYQVLCYNCNNAKHIYAICPHQLVTQEVTNA